MIRHINRFTNRNNILIQVYYTNGRVREFRKNDNLPMTVTKILIDGTCTETRYFEGGKKEKFIP